MPVTSGSAHPLVAGRYVVERVLGEGATAVVFLARDTEGGRMVAIKVLRPELAESAANTRFLREIRRTGQLQHPHILPVLDIGETDGRPYFVLPHMEGGTLRQRLKRERQLSIADAIAITRTVAEALDYAHGRGLIHRDVKPENILFTDGQACLGDFGIARALETVYGETASTSANVVRGTPAYMSPEQAAGSETLDGRSDVYSLACVFYEMVTGMQAFMGPTPESVIAMRFAHPPREIRVYRPSVSREVEAAVQRALSLHPADRYATAAEFVSAVSEGVSTTQQHASAREGMRRNRWTLLAASAVIVAGMSAVTLSAARRDDPPLDTMRIALLPLEVDTGRSLPWRDDDLLQNGLGRWREVSIVDQFQVADLIRRRGRVTTIDDAAAVARSVGAGRFVRGRRSALGADWRVTVVLYDATSGAPVHQRSEIVRNDVESALAAYAAIVDSLLLRGGVGDSALVDSRHAMSLAAVRAFGTAQEFLADWQLGRADSALASAVEIDDRYARAHLWLAQVRAWRGRPPEAWRMHADLALAGTALSDRERGLARALSGIAAGRFDAACAAYARLVAANDRDFAGWFGLGQCRMLNKTVEVDARSPSGYRFQGSAHTAMNAYEKALELLPSVYRRYQGTSFQHLQAMMLVTPHMIRGVGSRDGSVYYGLPGWSSDSLVLVPYPAERFVRDGPKPPGYDRALRERVAALRRITAGWSSAFPNSAGAKEAMAAALESQRDPSAIDTLLRARELASEPAHRTELAAREVMLRLRFPTPDTAMAFAAARRLADSLLTGAVTDSTAALLVPVALLRGRCALAAELIDRSVPATTAVSGRLWALSQRAIVQQTLGCPAPASAATLHRLAQRIDVEAAGAGRNAAAVMDGFLLLRPAIQGIVLDPRTLDRLRATTGFPQAIAGSNLVRGDTASARTILQRAESSWLRPPTPDIGLATARIWLAMRDTAAARGALDITLGAMDSYGVALFFYDAGTTSAYLSAAILRSALGGPLPPSSHAARRAVAAMWHDADSASNTISARLTAPPVP